MHLLKSLIVYVRISNFISKSCSNRKYIRINTAKNKHNQQQPNIQNPTNARKLFEIKDRAIPNRRCMNIERKSRGKQGRGDEQKRKHVKHIFFTIIVIFIWLCRYLCVCRVPINISVDNFIRHHVSCCISYILRTMMLLLSLPCLFAARYFLLGIFLPWISSCKLTIVLTSLFIESLCSGSEWICFGVALNGAVYVWKSIDNDFWINDGLPFSDYYRY